MVFVPDYTLYTLEASNITIVGGGSLSGFTQGSGIHLAGKSIVLNSNSWQQVEITDNDASFQDNDGSQQLTNATVYDGVPHAAGRVVEAEYQLTLEDAAGNSYTVIGFNIRETGSSDPVYGTVEGLAFIGPVGGFPPVGEPLTVTGTSEGPIGSSTPYSTYATPPCFVPGTMIETAHGAIAVENVQSGMQVRTLDAGLQTVRWAGATQIDWRTMMQTPRLRPVRIAKDAFGPGCPVKDMWVSPQHKLLQGGMRAAMYFGSDEVLVAAKHLLDDNRIVTDNSVANIVYCHLAFDAHHLILSDGVWTESFLPGKIGLSGLQDDTHTEVEWLFPGASIGEFQMAAARPILKRREAQFLRAA